MIQIQIYSVPNIVHHKPRQAKPATKILPRILRGETQKIDVVKYVELNFHFIGFPKIV